MPATRITKAIVSPVLFSIYLIDDIIPKKTASKSELSINVEEYLRKTVGYFISVLFFEFMLEY